MSFLISQISRFSSARFPRQGSKNGLQDKINKLVSNEESFLFKGSFFPGKISQNELKILKRAEREIEDWNQAVVKAREESTKK